MNDRKTLKNLITSEIKRKELSTFTAKDFIELGNIRAINKSLERMENSGSIRRIISGVYDIPQYSAVIKEYGEPSIRGVAQALARTNNWKISPSGNSALNDLGLSTQVPAQYIYVSSGPYKNYSIGSIELIFKHTNNRLIYDSTKDTALLIQAIKAIGRGNITIEQEDNIRDKFRDDSVIARILSESKQSPVWIYETIRKIFEVTNY
jgi:hypothetical protein